MRRRIHAYEEEDTCMSDGPEACTQAPNLPKSKQMETQRQDTRERGNSMPYEEEDTCMSDDKRRRKDKTRDT
jgi:hypothetical protein